MKSMKTYTISGDRDTLIKKRTINPATGETIGLELHRHITPEQTKDLMEIYFGLPKNHYEHPEWGRSRKPKHKKKTKPLSMTERSKFYLADQDKQTQNKTSHGRITSKWIPKGNQ